VAEEDTELEVTIIVKALSSTATMTVRPDGRLYVVSFGDGKIYAISGGGTAPLAVGATSLPAAEVGVAYNGDLNISGGVPPYVVSLDAGTLPAGLNPVGGAISGTPTVRRKARLTLRVTDDGGASLERRFTLSVLGAVSINNQSLPSGRVGRRYNARLKAKAGRKPYAWSLIAGSLPLGLTFDATTAAISGTPLAVGESSLTFRVIDSLGGSIQKTLALSIR